MDGFTQDTPVTAADAAREDHYSEVQRDFIRHTLTESKLNQSHLHPLFTALGGQPDTRNHPMYGVAASYLDKLQNSFGYGSQAAMAAGIYQGVASGGFNMPVNMGSGNILGQSKYTFDVASAMSNQIQNHFYDASGRPKTNMTGMLNRTDMGGLFAQIAGVGGFGSIETRVDKSNTMVPNPEQMKKSVELMEKHAKAISVLKETYRDKNIDQLMKIALDVTGMTVGADNPELLRQKLSQLDFGARATHTNRNYVYQTAQGFGALSASILAGRYGGTAEDYGVLSAAMGHGATMTMLAAKNDPVFNDGRFNSVSPEERAAAETRNKAVMLGENSSVVKARVLLQQDEELGSKQKARIQELMDNVKGASTDPEMRASRSALSSYLNGLNTFASKEISEMSNEQLMQQLSAEQASALNKDLKEELRNRVGGSIAARIKEKGNFADGDKAGRVAEELVTSFDANTLKEIQKLATAEDRKGLGKLIRDNEANLSKGGANIETLLADINSMTGADVAKTIGFGSDTVRRRNPGMTTRQSESRLEQKMLEAEMEKLSLGDEVLSTNGIIKNITDFAEGVLGMKPSMATEQETLGYLRSINKTQNAKNAEFTDEQLQAIVDSGGEGLQEKLLKATGAKSLADLSKKLRKGKGLNAVGANLIKALRENGMTVGLKGEEVMVAGENAVGKAQAAQDMVSKELLLSKIEGNEMAESAVKSRFEQLMDKGVDEKEFQEKFEKAIEGLGAGKVGIKEGFLDNRDDPEFEAMQQLFSLNPAAADAQMTKAVQKLRKEAETTNAQRDKDKLETRANELDELRKKLKSGSDVVGRLRLENFQEVFLELLDSAMKSLNLDSGTLKPQP